MKHIHNWFARVWASFPGVWSEDWTLYKAPRSQRRFGHWHVSKEKNHV